MVELQYRLLVMNGFLSLQAMYPDTVPEYYGILISGLQSDR